MCMCVHCKDAVHLAFGDSRTTGASIEYLRLRAAMALSCRWLLLADGGGGHADPLFRQTQSSTVRCSLWNWKRHRRIILLPHTYVWAVRG